MRTFEYIYLTGMQPYLETGTHVFETQGFLNLLIFLEPGTNNLYKWPVILEKQWEGPMKSIYNILLWPGFSMHDMHQVVREIFDG